MSDDDLQYDTLYQLTKHAAHLNGINTPDPAATAFFEVLSGTLIWRNETNSDTPVYVIWALRQLWAYRTHLMLNHAEPAIEFWDKCVSLFPNWIGFLPERRKATPELLAEYRRGDLSTKWCLRQIEREWDTDEK